MTEIVEFVTREFENTSKRQQGGRLLIYRLTVGKDCLVMFSKCQCCCLFRLRTVSLAEIGQLIMQTDVQCQTVL